MHVIIAVLGILIVLAIINAILDFLGWVLDNFWKIVILTAFVVVSIIGFSVAAKETAIILIVALVVFLIILYILKHGKNTCINNKKDLSSLDSERNDRDLLNALNEVLNTLSLCIKTTEESSLKGEFNSLYNTIYMIIEELIEHPNKQDQIKMLQNYYLPEVKKLLTTYVNLSKKDHSSENIVSTLNSISSVVTELDRAFKNILNQLYENENQDIESDIKVLRDMLQRDGLINGGKQDNSLRF